MLIVCGAQLISLAVLSSSFPPFFVGCRPWGEDPVACGEPALLEPFCLRGLDPLMHSIRRGRQRVFGFFSGVCLRRPVSRDAATTSWAMLRALSKNTKINFFSMDKTKGYSDKYAVNAHELGNAPGSKGVRNKAQLPGTPNFCSTQMVPSWRFNKQNFAPVLHACNFVPLICWPKPESNPTTKTTKDQVCKFTL